MDHQPDVGRGEEIETDEKLTTAAETINAEANVEEEEEEEAAAPRRR